MRPQSRWEAITQADPQHSHRYIERFRRMAADGADLNGEARLVDAMVPRGARILDAGCGPGRVGGHLAQLGHTVVGVDVDPVLIDAARDDHPGATWLVGDLGELDLALAKSPDAQTPFDLVVCAGNVMTFLAPDTHLESLAKMRASTHSEGRVVIGFGAGRGYPFAEFRTHVAGAGLRVDALFSTWDLRPFDEHSDFLVAVLSHSA